MREEVIKFLENETAFDEFRDHVYAITPEGRNDICVARKMLESKQRDIIYLFWEKDGVLKNKVLMDSKKTGKFLHVNEIVVDKEKIVVRVDSGEGYKNAHLMQKSTVLLTELI